MTARFAKYYNENALQKKLRRFSLRAGQQLVYAVLLLYYCFISPNVPLKKKASIAAALGYFIFPFDFLPDLLPLIGFADDLTVIIYALVQISTSLTPEIRNQARKKMEKWFKTVDDKKLLAVEKRLPIPGEN